MSNLTPLQCIAYATLGSFIGCSIGCSLFPNEQQFERSYLEAKISYAKDPSELNFNIIDLYYRALSFRKQKKYIGFAESFAIYHYIERITTIENIDIKKLYAKDLNWYLRTLRKAKSKTEYVSLVNNSFEICRFTKSKQEEAGVKIL